MNATTNPGTSSRQRAEVLQGINHQVANLGSSGPQLSSRSASGWNSSFASEWSFAGAFE